MKEKYLSHLVLCLLLISVLPYFMIFALPKSQFWTIISFVISFISLSIATYLLFILTKCKIFLVLLASDLIYFGNKILNFYILEIGRA